MCFRMIAAFSSLLLLAIAAEAASLKLKTLQVGTQVYRDVTVLGANTTDIYFNHSEGIANVKLKYLNEKIQKRFNYDAQAATEAERQQAEDDARYQAALAADMAAKAQKEVEAARNAGITSELSLADPISDKSLLGKPAPVFPETWLGEKPKLEGKFVLAFVWTPWSIPCQKQIPVLNALQKKYAEELSIVAVTTEPEEAVLAMEQPKVEFASALDPNAKLVAAAGITSIPYVLLSNPSGIVLYQGHPAALNSTNLAAILKPAKPAE